MNDSTAGFIAGLVIASVLWLGVTARIVGPTCYERGTCNGIKDMQIQAVKCGFGSWETNEKGEVSFKWRAK